MRPEIEQVLVLSTAHMPGSQPDFGEIRADPHEYGYIVFLASSHPGCVDGNYVERAPDWLKPAVRLAQLHDCNYINFDQDADPVDDIPTFDW